MPGEKRFFQSKDNGGVAVWPLHNPAKPEFGNWAWVELCGSHVRFLRRMTPQEIATIQAGFMVWGEKLNGHPWALVRGLPTAIRSSVIATNEVDRHAGIGV